MNEVETVDYALMLLAPLGLVFLGGICVMADLVLLKRRGDADSVTSFVDSGSRPRSRSATGFGLFFHPCLRAGDPGSARPES